MKNKKLVFVLVGLIAAVGIGTYVLFGDKDANKVSTNGSDNDTPNINGFDSEISESKKTLYQKLLAEMNRPEGTIIKEGSNTSDIISKGMTF